MKLTHTLLAGALTLGLAAPAFAQDMSSGQSADASTAKAAGESSMAKSSSSPTKKAMHHKKAAMHSRKAAMAHEKAASDAMSSGGSTGSTTPPSK